jgi:hypothetical protein
MDKISTIKQNILLFIENQGLKKEDFFKNVGISYSNFKGKSLNSEIASDKLVTILTMFPQLNSDWLLTGKGEMLKQRESKEYKVNDVLLTLSEPSKSSELVALQKETIAILKREVEDLRNDKDFLKNVIEAKLVK